MPADAPNDGAASSSRGEEGNGEVRIGEFPYIMGREIGRGSFATVYKGYRIGPREPLAIKSVIRSKLTAKLLANLEAEVAILKAISHPNIVELKDCCKTSSHIYLVMAYCSAGDLSGYIKRRGRVPALDLVDKAHETLYPHPKEGGLNEAVVKCFLSQLAEALKFLRSQNLIHRDIKPQNLLLQPPDASALQRGHPQGIPLLKVADFGFARSLPAASLAETLCGSPLYMAPEILRYEKYDAKADLWSVGAVLYEMCVGKPPFRAQNHVELLRRIEKGEDRIKFPDERTHRPDPGDGKEPYRVANDLKDLVRQLLKRNPVERMSFDDFFASPVLASNHAQRQISRSEPSVPASIPLSPSPRPESSEHLEGEEATPSSNGADPEQPRSASATQVPRDYVSTGAERRQAPRNQEQQQKYVTTAAERGSAEERTNGPRVALTSRQASFVPKYVVGGAARTSAATVQLRQQAPSSRKTESPISGRSDSAVSTDGATPRTAPPAMSNLARLAAQSGNPPGSGIGLGNNNVPGSNSVSGEDSVLGKEYVVVEKRNIDANALVDEKPSSSKRTSFLSGMSLGAAAAFVRAQTRHHSAAPMTPSKRDIAEDELAAALEDIARKAYAIAEFAHSRMPAGNPYPSPAAMPLSAGQQTAYARAGSGSPYRRVFSVSPESPSAPPTGIRSDDVATAEALVLYVKALSILQKGLDRITEILNVLSEKAAGARLSNAMRSVRSGFAEYFEKAQTARSRCGDVIPDSAQQVDALIYHKALEISRGAAVNELVGEDPEGSRAAYETALSLLRAILDNGGDANPSELEDDDRVTIEKFVFSIESRLRSLRRRESTTFASARG